MNFELVKENGVEVVLVFKVVNFEEILVDVILLYSVKCGEKIELRCFVLIDVGIN